MKYLKVWESFDKGIEEWDSNWQTRNQIMRQTHGTDFFTKRELSFLRRFFVKTEQDDFFRVSGEKLSGKAPDGTPLSGERRSTFKARYMPGDNQINPIEISITRLKDDYFMVEISCLNKEESRFSEYTIANTPRPKVYLVDTFEDLKYFLSNLRKYWKKINDSWKPIKESLVDDVEYYKEVGFNEHLVWWDKMVDITPKDIDLISGYFPDWEMIEMGVSPNMTVKKDTKYIDFKKGKRKISIFRLEDEWWYVMDQYYREPLKPGIDLYPTAAQSASRYLCDQFSGLEKLIMDELVDYSQVDWGLKESLNYKSDLWTQIDTIEKQRKLSESHIRFNLDEFEKLNQFVESLGHNFKTKDEAYLTSNLFIILNPVKSRSKLDLCVYKLQDDWYIVSFETSNQRSSYSINFLCDQLDAVHELIKISTSTGDIKVPFDYFELTSRVSYPRDVNKTSNSLLCAELIRQKIQEYNFQIEYDEILPKTRGSNSIRFWKAVEFSDLSQEAIEFFNVRREQGRRVIMIRISFSEYDDDFFMIHFGLGPELSMKHRSFECQSVEGVKKLLDDKFGQLGKSGTTIKQGQLEL